MKHIMKVTGGLTACSFLLLEICSLSATEKKSEKIKSNAHSQSFIIGNTAIRWNAKPHTPVYDTVSAISFKSYQQEWGDIEQALLENHKNGGFFAPLIDLAEDQKWRGNCYSTAAGITVRTNSPSLACPNPGLIGQVASNEKPVKEWHPHFFHRTDVLKEYLEQDGIVAKIPEGKEKNYFPIIALMSTMRSQSYHFIRPSMTEGQLYFSEKRFCGDTTAYYYENIDALKKRYKENEIYQHPTIYYVPKNYLGAILDLE